MPSSHLILCCPLLLLPPIPPNIRVFSTKSTLRMRWPEYWSFSFSISPSNEHQGPNSFRMDWDMSKSGHILISHEVPPPQSKEVSILIACESLWFLSLFPHLTSILHHFCFLNVSLSFKAQPRHTISVVVSHSSPLASPLFFAPVTLWHVLNY